jgi:phosphoribosylformylglycinamidine synthase
MAKPKALVLTGYGINCDRETEHAFNVAGGEGRRVHINDIIDGREKLADHQILAVPGGFSYGDDIASGRVLANKLRTNLGEQVRAFIEKGNLVIGICNGFQVLVKSGILPGTADGGPAQSVTLTFNGSARYEDRWVHLGIRSGKCVFTRGIERLYLPVAHGEGRFTDGRSGGKMIDELKMNDQVVVVYCDESGEEAGGSFPANPNGSEADIAGICDSTGRVFGMMPHPERFLHFTHHPNWTRAKASALREGRTLPDEGEGLKIFQNAVSYFS